MTLSKNAEVKTIFDMPERVSQKNPLTFLKSSWHLRCSVYDDYSIGKEWQHSARPLHQDHFDNRPLKE